LSGVVLGAVVVVAISVDVAAVIVSGRMEAGGEIKGKRCNI